jgi:predicted O-linked N-acetylglucosamine transferase (SPINDLY family)
VQVSYLGYPGTMGAGWMDYLIADECLIPQTSRCHYTEKIVYLPDSYQVNDGGRRIAETVFTRSDMGLPETGFVFCCFNNNYKITPQTFDGWMRILGQVEGSVLWLLEDNSAASAHLRAEAERRGIGRDRLVFAGAHVRRRAPGAAPAGRSLPGHAALQRPHDGERRAVGRAAGADLQGAVVCESGCGQPAPCRRTA